MKSFITHKATLWTLLGATLYCLCFPKWNLYFLAPLSFFCFFQAITQLKNAKHALQTSLLASFIIGIGGFHWIAYVMHNFGQLPYPIAVLMLLLYCFIASPQLLLFYTVGSWCQKKIPLSPLLAPIFYTTLYISLEFLCNLWKIFPESIGNTQIHWITLAQSASIGGVSLLSFYVCYLGFSFGIFWKHKKIISIGHIVAAAILIIGAHFWGKDKITELEKLPTNNLSFSILQANIGDLDKLVSENGNSNAIASVLNRYLELTRKAQGTLLIWPETAFPLNFPSFENARAGGLSKAYKSLMQEVVTQKNASLLFGGYEQIANAGFNSALLMNNKGEIVQSYRKKHLLLFGEYMPFGSIIPALKLLNPQMGDFTEGPGPIPLLWEKDTKAVIKLGVNICYETIMPGYIRSFAKNGANVLINLTNDSWFGPGFEPFQHLQLAILRSIENRLPIIRATNTGISAAIDSFGRIQSQSPLFEPYILEGSVSYFSEQPRTVYTKYGDAFAWCCALFSLLIILNFKFRLPLFRKLS